ncbi:MAG: hypothetical protein JSS02_28320 [Planctomycetes bacterium]|nr:hypothetical protein [Planctomycetota bacterium]
MLQVGLIGLGPEWQQRYRPALQNLRNRLQIRSVFATVSSQAEVAAADLKCDPAPGVVGMAERDDIQAFIVLDSDWHLHVPAWTACRLGKPVFLAGRQATRFCRPDLRRFSAESGVTLMPGLAHRYTPATSRLRELIATRLGRPQSIEIEAAPESLTSTTDKPGLPVDLQELLAVAIDWCTCVIGTTPTSIAQAAANGSNGAPTAELRYDLEFRRPQAGGEAPRVAVSTVQPNAAVSHRTYVVPVIRRALVRCAKGQAILEPPHQITWDVNNARVAEALTSDRPEFEVMLDHFTRRVLGGLIPVPSLDDLHRAREFAARVAP